MMWCKFKYLKHFLLGASVMILTGCSGSHTDLQAYLNSVREGAVPKAEPLPALPALSSVAYHGADARDPYQTTPVGAPQQNSDTAPAQNCPQPPRLGVPTALQRVALDQLQLRGILGGGQNRDPVALITANDGQLHRVTVGDFMGLNYGRIAAIQSNRIVLREWIATGNGCWQQRETQLTLVEASRSTNP